MNYIIKTMDGIAVYDFNKQCYKQSLQSYLNELCIQELTTLKGRQDAVKKILDIKRNVPIFIRPDTILIQTHELRDHRVICLNATKIITITDNLEGSQVLFEDGTAVKIMQRQSNMKRKCQKVDRLIKYLKIKNI